MEGVAFVPRGAENTGQSAPWGVSVETLKGCVEGLGSWHAAQVVAIGRRWSPSSTGRRLVFCALYCALVHALTAVCELVQQESRWFSWKCRIRA